MRIIPRTVLRSRRRMEVLSALALIAGAAVVIFSGTLSSLKQRLAAYIYSCRPTSNVTLHHLNLNIGSIIVLKIRPPSADVILTATLGVTIPKHLSYDVTSNESAIVVRWQTGVRLSIELRSDGPGTFYDVTWEQTNGGKGVVLTDMIDTSNGFWYGGPELFKQTWPISDWSHSVRPYTTADSYQGQYGGVQERYWLSSTGVAVFVERDVPLFVSMNGKHQPKLGLTAQFASPYSNSQNKKLWLKYTLVVGDNIIDTHKLAANAFIGRPEGIPDERMFRHPIWSTWARFKKNINHQKVIDFAREINENGFPNSQMEIDDDWTEHYGDLDFDRAKFPDPKRTVDELKSLGFRVSLWVHPFASPLSRAWDEGRGKAFFIRSWYTGLPALHLWWNGIGSMLDLTNQDACRWFTDNLEKLQRRYGVDSFKFDAGESNFIPAGAVTHLPVDNPNDYSRRYAELALGVDPTTRMLEVRVGAGTQRLPVMVRVMDKDSTWTYDNGLRSLIPHVLLFGILGYPFVLPDMIGGNAYTGITMTTSQLPPRELFIRWLQANALLPSMQFSVTPWQYDEEVVAIARAMCDLHVTFTPTILSLAREATQTGHPIVRPIWWVAPTDNIALSTDSEFLLGNDVIVAPVLEEGARSRDIYLPAGRWRDVLRGEVLEGGRWYRKYRVELAELPYFTRVTTGSRT